MTAHRLLDPQFTAQPAPRGRGLDRRHIITIDGTHYKAGPRETAILAQRMTAKHVAANWAWACLELTTMALFFGAGAVWWMLTHGA